MKILNKLLLPGLAVFGALSLTTLPAHADTLSDDFSISLEVVPSCSLSIPNDIDIDLRGVQDGIRGDIPDWMLLGVSQSSHAIVLCNLDLPYTLEVDSGSAGAIVLTDSATSKSVPMRLLQADKVSVWGQDANGNAIAGIGTGEAQDVMFWVDASWGYTVPVGTYTTRQVATLNF